MALWAALGARINDTISAFAEAGRVLQTGGQNIQGAGVTLGEAFRGVPLVGVIDLVLPGAEGAIITDFKTTSRGGELPELTHELQLSSYSYLFRQSSRLSEEALEIRNLVKTKTPRVENHRYGPRSQAHYLRLFAVIRAYLDALDAGNYVIRPSHLCTACEFSSSHCAQWVG